MATKDSTSGKNRQMDRLDSLTDSQLLAAALLGAGLAAASGVVYIAEASSQASGLASELKGLAADAKQAMASLGSVMPAKEGESLATTTTSKAASAVAGKAKEAISAAASGGQGVKLSPEALKRYRDVMRRLAAWKSTAASPLAIAGSALGCTGCSALAFRLADSGALTLGNGATTVLPALLLAGVLPASMTRAKLPGLSTIAERVGASGGVTGTTLMPAILRQYTAWRLPYSEQLAAAADDVAGRISSLADAHPGTAGAIKEAIHEAEELADSAWTLAPGALLASALGLGALLLMAPKAISAFVDRV